MRTRWNTESFTDKINQLNPAIEVIGEYKNAHTKIKCRCKVDGHIWEPTPTHLLYDGRGCPKCRGGVKKTHDEFVSQVADINKNIIILGKYISDNKKIKYKCKIDGNIWSAQPTSIIQGHGCPVCGRKTTEDAIRKSHDVFVEEIKELSPDLEILSQYSNAHGRVLCKCKIHNYKWSVIADTLARGSGCPVCNMSRGEKIIGRILKKAHIKFVSQMSFADCIDKRPLPFDFYIQSLNICIEYDGEQHYHAIDVFGGDVALKKQRKRDLIKTNYCKSKGIKLIRVPYTVKDIEAFLQKEIATVSKVTMLDRSKLGI